MGFRGVALNVTIASLILVPTTKRTSTMIATVMTKYPFNLLKRLKINPVTDRYNVNKIRYPI